MDQLPSFHERVARQIFLSTCEITISIYTHYLSYSSFIMEFTF